MNNLVYATVGLLLVASTIYVAQIDSAPEQLQYYQNGNANSGTGYYHYGNNYGRPLQYYQNGNANNGQYGGGYYQNGNNNGNVVNNDNNHDKSDPIYNTDPNRKPIHHKKRPHPEEKETPLQYYQNGNPNNGNNGGYYQNGNNNGNVNHVDHGKTDPIYTTDPDRKPKNHKKRHHPEEKETPLQYYQNGNSGGYHGGYYQNGNNRGAN